MQSRLDEVRQSNAADANPAHDGASPSAVVLGGDVESSPVTSESMKSFFTDVDRVKATIQYVKGRTAEVARLQDEAINAVRTEDQNSTSDKLSSVLSDVNKRCAEAKQLLTAIKAKTEELEASGGTQPTELRLRKQMYSQITQHFVNAVRSYQQAQQTYKSKMKSKVARQVRIVKPDATYEEIDDAMKSGDPGAIYRAAILQQGADPIAQAYVDVQAKYKDVLRLEESVGALNQMFRDMALLVERQGEMLDQIEFSVETAADHVEKGKTEVNKALIHRKSIRKKYFIIGLIVLVIIVVMALTLSP